MTSRRTRRPMIRAASTALAGALVAATTVVVGAGPAQAATYSFDDPAGDIPTGADILRVTVNNGRRIVVKISHRDLDRAAHPAVFVYLDTKRSRSGPEFVMDVNQYEWYLWRTRHWKRTGDAPLGSPYSGRFDYDTNVTTIRIPRRTVGYPGKVRVSVVALNGSSVDYAPGYRTFCRWVPRG